MFILYFLIVYLFKYTNRFLKEKLKKNASLQKGIIEK
jgi:hypothetical protein